MPKEMRRSIAIKYRHLDIHEDDIWFRMIGRWRHEKVIKRFFPVPYRIDREPEFLDCFQSDLLVDWTTPVNP